MCLISCTTLIFPVFMAWQAIVLRINLAQSNGPDTRFGYLGFLHISRRCTLGFCHIVCRSGVERDVASTYSVMSAIPEGIGHLIPTHLGWRVR